MYTHVLLLRSVWQGTHKAIRYVASPLKHPAFVTTSCCWVAGIKKLEMQAPGSEGRRNYETTGVFSPDGEYLPFVSPIVTEGRPEEWLNRVEEAMFAATKKHLFRVC